MKDAHGTRYYYHTKDIYVGIELQKSNFANDANVALYVHLDDSVIPERERPLWGYFFRETFNEW